MLLHMRAVQPAAAIWRRKLTSLLPNQLYSRSRDDFAPKSVLFSKSHLHSRLAKSCSTVLRAHDYAQTTYVLRVHDYVCALCLVP